MTLRLTAINRGDYDGTGRTKQLRTAGGDVYYADSITDLHGTVLTTAVTLDVQSKTLGAGSNGAKTADATCAKKPSNICKY